MKRITLTILAMVLMLGFAEKGAASPKQTRCQMVVYVPFAFQVAGHTVPAGYYRFEQVLGNTDGVEVLVVRGLDRPFYQTVVVEVENMDGSQPDSKIVFRYSGENLLLAGLCSHSKHASLELYDAGTKQPMMTATRKTDDVVLPVPSDGEVLAMARSAR